MAHYLSFFDDYSVSRKLIELFDVFLFNSKNNKSKYTGYSRFLLQLQVQMKTSLDVMNMNHLVTYVSNEVRSQHIVDFQRNAMPL